MTYVSVRNALVFSVLLAALPAPASARCMSEWAAAYPEVQGAVPTNAVVVVHLEGRAWQGVQASAFGLRDANGRRVALRVVLDERQAAALLGRRTIVLTPARALRANTRYTLVSPPSSARGARGPRLSFLTGASADHSPPVLQSAVAQSFQSAEYGCGPAHQIPIRISASADAVFARIRVARSDADLRAGRLVADIVEPIRNGVVQFGHGMCGGNFALDPGQSYVATVTVADAAFVESAPSAPMRLVAQ